MASDPSSPADARLDDEARASIRSRLRKARLKEWCMFESAPAKQVVAAAEYARAQVEFARGQRLAAWRTLTRLHRAALSEGLSARIEQRLNGAFASGDMQDVLREHIATTTVTPPTKKLFSDPGSIFGPHATVLASATPGQKGVMLLNYTYVYAPFAKLFDLQKIAERYYLVLEMSWSGTCEESILAYATLPTAVFVESTEPRDMEFLRRLRSPALVPVGVAANWWVDHELYTPRPEIEKDADVIMVAAWAEFKRHGAFFDALARARAAGRRLKTILVGYPSGLTMKDIADLAEYFGVRDQVELHEWLPPEQVARHFNRARVNVVWSLREGFNRAIVEGMFSDIPFVERLGHNYGYHHPYVNDQTGCYTTETQLPSVLIDMVDHPERYNPRAWAIDHMTYEHATQILEETIAAEAARRGERWSGRLSRHMSVLHGNQYTDPADAQRYQADYEFLRSTLRS